MANVIIRVELRGEPGADIYKQLHEFMKGKKWSTTLEGSAGAVVDLPHAMYAGSNNSDLIKLASLLRDEITSQIWTTGAIVLAIAWNGWGQAG